MKKKRKLSQKSKTSAFKNFIGNIATYTTIVVATIAVILSSFDMISDSVFKAIVITLLGLISIDNLLFTKNQLEQMNSSVEELSNQVKAVKIKKFDSADEAIEYLARRTKEAKVSIDQASIDSLRAKRTSEARKQYENARETLISADRITYRYIGIVDIERRMNSMKRIMAGRNLTKLFVACLTGAPDNIPMMSFVVFDKKEVFIRVPYEYGEKAEYLAIEGQEIANLYLGYFEKMWGTCQKVQNVEQLNAILDTIMAVKKEA